LDKDLKAKFLNKIQSIKLILSAVWRVYGISALAISSAFSRYRLADTTMHNQLLFCSSTRLYLPFDLNFTFDC